MTDDRRKPNASDSPTAPTTRAADGTDVQPVIELDAVHKTYGMDGHAVHALRGVSLTVPTGDYVAIMGASGSGKSTLMNIVGCLDVPTSGRYLLDGIEAGELSDRQLALVRSWNTTTKLLKILEERDTRS